MLYFDTNFLIPLFRAEPMSSRVARFVAGLPKEQFAISEWTRVEFVSVLGRLVRMGELDSPTAASADVRFDSMIADAFAVLLPTADDYGLARRYLGQHASGLRAGDALHLAVAANHAAAVIFTLDKRLLAAGAALGLPVNAGIDP